MKNNTIDMQLIKTNSILFELKFFTELVQFLKLLIIQITCFISNR